eukprot:1155518-Pelagomonas_calceolata.AAC.4
MTTDAASMTIYPLLQNDYRRCFNDSSSHHSGIHAAQAVQPRGAWERPGSTSGSSRRGPLTSPSRPNSATLSPRRQASAAAARAAAAGRAGYAGGTAKGGVGRAAAVGRQPGGAYAQPSAGGETAHQGGDGFEGVQGTESMGGGTYAYAQPSVRGRIAHQGGGSLEVMQGHESMQGSVSMTGQEGVQGSQGGADLGPPVPEEVRQMAQQFDGSEGVVRPRTASPSAMQVCLNVCCMQPRHQGCSCACMYVEGRGAPAHGLAISYAGVHRLRAVLCASQSEVVRAEVCVEAMCVLARVHGGNVCVKRQSCIHSGTGESKAGMRFKRTRGRAVFMQKLGQRVRRRVFLYPLFVRGSEAGLCCTRRAEAVCACTALS